ncbi:MAG: permease [Dehalococcoidales bacterium]|nr:permease [Dehalococcoidales bacterium]
MLIQFFIIFKDYLVDVLPFLALGFFLSGVINEFIPTGWVEKHLGGKGIKPLIYSSLVGTALPICCIGSLPVAVSLHQKGARLGPVLAFLVATPATSIPALLVSYALLGIKFTVFIFFAVITMGLIAGLAGNLIRAKPKTLATQRGLATDPVCEMQVETDKAPKIKYNGEVYYFCCTHCRQEFESNAAEFSGTRRRNYTHRIRHVFKYAFVDMVREIGPEILLGLALAALVATVTPVGKFVGGYLGEGLGYIFSLIFGIMMYICATASVPLVHAFISQGMNIGAGMVMLMVGPVTSWGAILVLRKEFGARVLLVYLATISLTALILGYVFSLI